MVSNLYPFPRVLKRSSANLGHTQWWSAFWGSPSATLTSAIDSVLCGNLRGTCTLLILIRAAFWSSSPSNKITLRRLRGGRGSSLITIFSSTNGTLPFGFPTIYLRGWWRGSGSPIFPFTSTMGRSSRPSETWWGRRSRLTPPPKQRKGVNLPYRR
ncbi:hypothetical protein LINPERHAP1_LOCUS36319 [Linum perenne]